jgi:ribosomal protein S12
MMYGFFLLTKTIWFNCQVYNFVAEWWQLRPESSYHKNLIGFINTRWKQYRNYQMLTAFRQACVSSDELQRIAQCPRERRCMLDIVTVNTKHNNSTTDKWSRITDRSGGDIKLNIEVGKLQCCNNNGWYVRGVVVAGLFMLWICYRVEHCYISNRLPSITEVGKLQ